jgi:FtsP/CotA-like multicopper oxidase with cupredoxin domain
MSVELSRPEQRHIDLNCLAVIWSTVIRLQKGQKVRIHFKNELPDPTIAHWHGLHVPADVDGHPGDAIPQGRDIRL